MEAILTILARVAVECQRQLDKWGEQHHPDGTGPWVLRTLTTWASNADQAKAECEAAAAAGDLSWLLILYEEVAEAAEERDPERLKTELTQVAAVCASWIKDIESRHPQPAEPYGDIYLEPAHGDA